MIILFYRWGIKSAKEGRDFSEVALFVKCRLEFRFFLFVFVIRFIVIIYKSIL